MLKRMILHTLLAALVVGLLAAAYQARADEAVGFPTQPIAALAIADHAG
ncbi:hypothetical protein [Azospirillum sp. B506]|nr:hypothetical protein [Azospirillum sp. B506]